MNRLADYEIFSRDLVLTAEIFNVKLSLPKVEMYFQQLKEFPLSDISLALSKRYQFMPKPWDIAQTIQGSDKQRSKLIAEEQADIVLRALEDGADSKPVFTDPVTAHLMSTRWKFRNWGRNHKSEDPWWRINFVAAHQDISEVGEFAQLGHEDSKKMLEKITVKAASSQSKGDRSSSAKTATNNP